MGPLFLFITGGVIALFSLWKLHGWLVALKKESDDTNKKPASSSSPFPDRGPYSEKGPRRLADVEREVALLAEAGLSVAEIARRVGLTRAEVQLILGLRSPR